MNSDRDQTLSNAGGDVDSSASSVVDVSATVRKAFWDIVQSMEPTIAQGIRPSEIMGFKSALEADKAAYVPIPKDDLMLFNAAYFRRNLLKFLIVLDRFGARLEPKPFIDFGAGSGAAGAAWIRMSQIEKSKITSSIHSDRSLLQLDIGKSAFTALTSEASLPSFRTDFETKTVGDASHICLFSFCICELMAEGKTPKEILSFVGKELIAVDFRETLLSFTSALGKALNPIVFVHEEYELGSDLASVLGQKKLKVSGLYAQRIL